MATDKARLVFLPLADPVISAIFASVEVAGLAAKSLVRAILSDGGANIGNTIGEVLSVTPQRVHGRPGERGCRVDVEIVTDDNERVIVEIQLNDDVWILQRNLFAASRIFTEMSTTGTTSAEMALLMPKVITINILNYTIRDGNADIVQPVKLMYEKPPNEVAMPQFEMYNVQLARFREVEVDWDNELHLWLYALNTAQTEKKSLSEVVSMTAQLTAYAAKDAGFRQFCERYDMVAEDPQTREAYYDWYSEALRAEGERLGAERRGRIEGEKQGRIEGEKQGRAEGEKQGRAEGEKAALRKLVEAGVITIEQAIQTSGLSIAEITNLRQAQ